MYSDEERARLSARRRQVLERRVAAGTWRMAPVPVIPPPAATPARRQASKSSRGKSWGYPPETVKLVQELARPLIEEAGLSCQQTAHILAQRQMEGIEDIPASTMRRWLYWGYPHKAPTKERIPAPQDLTPPDNDV